MRPSHQIRVDLQSRLLHLQLEGFFDEPAIANFMIDREKAYAQLGSAGDHLTLCDVSKCAIQSQQSFERFRALLMERSRWGKRMAFIVPEGSLAAMQVTRLIAQRPDLQVFGDVPSALAWLRLEMQTQKAAQLGRT
jgi:hypothetical protein